MDLTIIAISVALVIFGLLIVRKQSSHRTPKWNLLAGIGYSMILGGSFFAAREMW